MIPTGSKLWFGVCGFALVAAVAYLVASGGEEYGSMVLLSLAFAGFTLGLLSSLIGDGDVREPRGGDAVTNTLTARREAQLGAAWPALTAVGLGVIAVGLASGGILLYVGLALVVAAGIEWMVQAWAERATEDLVANRDLRNRLMYPVEVPVLAAVMIAVVILAFSRVLLAVSKTGSTVVAIVVASIILGVAFLLTSRPKLSSSLLTVVVVLGALAMLGGGIVGGVVGEREFEHHDADHGGGEAVEALISTSSTLDYDEDLVTVPVGEPVDIVFENNQGGVQHNVHIEGREPGPLVTGPGTVTFRVEFDEPGEYAFTCDVHPVMQGTIDAVEQPATSDEVGGDEPAAGDESAAATVGDRGGDRS